MPSCPPCRRDMCDQCDGTAWRGSTPTYCTCWAGGHAYTESPGRWVGGEMDPRADEDAIMDAYERGRD